MSRRKTPVISASTETTGGHIVRFLSRSAVTIIAVCVTLVVMSGEVIGIRAPLGIAWTVAAAVGLGAAMFVIPFCESRFVPRGVWRVSDRSVAYEPYHGRGTRVVFDDVEALRVSKMRIEMFDGERMMWVGSATIGAKQWHALRQGIFAQLAGRFTLPTGVIHEYGWRDALASPRSRAVLALTGLSVMWLVVTWLAIEHQIGWPAIVLAGLMFSRVLVDTLMRRTQVLRRMQRAVADAGAPTA